MTENESTPPADENAESKPAEAEAKPTEAEATPAAAAEAAAPAAAEAQPEAAAPAAPAKPAASKAAAGQTARPKTYIWGTGRRKAAVARVRIAPGTGNIIVNKRTLAEFFPRLDHQAAVISPLEATERRTTYDVWVNVRGGGITGQAGAALLGVARALTHAEPEDEELHTRLKHAGLLTRDPRQVERKKYGMAGARRRFQFSKR